MNVLVKAELLNELFGLYKSLFTEKQIEYFQMYYELDYSFQEIASYFKISRNAVFDQLKKVEENLYLYEEKLMLLKKRNERLDYLNSYFKTKDIKFIEALKRMDE